jgi:guanosine-3',5'-bis(diphosphate) 3'-pyrophosphohydrolase
MQNNRVDIERIASIVTIEDASKYLFDVIKKSEKLEDALEFAIKAHEHQKRKSGEPYVVHPILVAVIVSSITDDESMAIAALLHDVVEDTSTTILEVEERYGKDVAHLVGGLTKIDVLRDENLISSKSDEKLIASALSFRKLLLASIQDVRVLVVKLCDRVHNMLTLDALPPHKQHRISEESVVVYAPIAQRLGISFIKNILEDTSFKYLFPKEQAQIQQYIQENYSSIEVRLNNFRHDIEKLLIKDGYCNDDFEILSRIKHNYSIYLKIQRKGIGIDEVLDLLAIRVLVKKPLDCYKVLGLVHLHYQPLSSRFKDYIAIAKENGYQTIHTSVFFNSAIYEVQIRTFDMHKVAELGVAAHWKYKMGGSNELIKLDWLSNLQYQNESIEDFYELIKNDLYSEDISVFSPAGKMFSLPRGAVALDFAYAVHSEIGDGAEGCLINKKRSSLLSELHNGDIVKIITTDQKITRCSWIDAVKTSRAKSHMKANCNNRIKAINEKVGLNIVSTIMGLDQWIMTQWCEGKSMTQQRCKITSDLNYLKEIVHKYSDDVKQNSRFKAFLTKNRFKLKPYIFGGLEFFHNSSISNVVFDYCCHPKSGDEIVAFLEKGRVHVHHKMCKNATRMIDEQKPMVFVRWASKSLYHYHLIVSMHNSKGALASFLTYLASIDIDIISIKLGHEVEEYVRYCDIELQSSEADLNKLRAKIEQKIKVIQFIRSDDAYKT